MATGLRLAALALAAWLAPNPAHAEDWDWHESLSPHFAVSHEMSWLPGGFQMSLEKMHGRLRMDLAMFSPWMAKERIKLYLYKDQKSYAAGQFSPPAWSNGIAIYEERTVAVPDQPDRKKLLEVIGHETTHLLFESYWGEAGKSPPSWLNEGLAMLEESDWASRPETSPWFSAMVGFSEEPLMPLEKLVAISPTEELKDDKEKVGLWYVQAYAAVHFLLRRHSRLQFKSFCAGLRDGKSLEESLWAAYRYRTIAKFEEAWKKWLKDPSHRQRLPRAAASAEAPGGSEEPKEKPRFGTMKGFKPLGP